MTEPTANKAMTDAATGRPYQRTYTCACGHSWDAPVLLSANTTQQSGGERSEWCPRCGKKFFYSSPAFTVDARGDKTYLTP